MTELINAADVALKISQDIYDIIGVQLSEYEKAILNEGVTFSKKQIPNHYATVVDSLETVTRLESEYNYLIYTLATHYEQLSFSFRTKYDPLFTMLTRSGLPNQAAVEAAALSKNNNELLILKNKMNRLEAILSYLKSEVIIIKGKVRSLDAKRSNTF